MAEAEEVSAVEASEGAEDEITINLQNLVCTAHLGCQLDLQLIARTARNAEYNPSRFQAVIMRIRDPKTTALIFHNGKMIITGAKKKEIAERAAMKYKEILLRIGFNVNLSEVSVQNITATFDCGFPVRLEALVYAHSSHATYEPELFPGLVYRMQDPKVVLLVFVSGKVVVTGAKSVEDVGRAVESIIDILLQYRKKTVVITAVDR